MVRPHLQYLKYVLIHKLYVFAAGVRIGGLSPRWLWRLAIHDLSKFRPSEWRGYVDNFYRPDPLTAFRQKYSLPEGGHVTAEQAPELEAAREEQKRRRASFNMAWLLHQKRNPHHWQFWLLHEDSGKTLVLTPPAVIADEMLADWIGAGSKVLALPTLDACIAETVAWYAANRNVIQLRQIVRDRIETNLHALALSAGLVQFAAEVESLKAARASIVIPGR